MISCLRSKYIIRGGSVKSYAQNHKARPKLKTFYDKNARPTLLPDVLCYIVL